MTNIARKTQDVIYDRTYDYAKINRKYIAKFFPTKHINVILLSTHKYNWIKKKKKKKNVKINYIKVFVISKCIENDTKYTILLYYVNQLKEIYLFNINK